MQALPGKQYIYHADGDFDYPFSLRKVGFFFIQTKKNFNFRPFHDSQ